MSQSLNHLNPHYYVHTATSAIQSPDIYQWGTTQTNLSQVTTFSLIIICLKEMIHWHQSWTMTDPPLTLPLNVITFCSNSLGTEHEIITWLWIYVQEVV